MTSDALETGLKFYVLQNYFVAKSDLATRRLGPRNRLYMTCFVGVCSFSFFLCFYDFFGHYRGYHLLFMSGHFLFCRKTVSSVFANFHRVSARFSESEDPCAKKRLHPVFTGVWYILGSILEVCVLGSLWSVLYHLDNVYVHFK